MFNYNLFSHNEHYLKCEICFNYFQIYNTIVVVMKANKISFIKQREVSSRNNTKLLNVRNFKELKYYKLY